MNQGTQQSYDRTVDYLKSYMLSQATLDGLHQGCGITYVMFNVKKHYEEYKCFHTNTKDLVKLLLLPPCL
jgi:hypothetical protein